MEDIIKQLQELIAREREDNLAQGPENYRATDYAYLYEFEETAFSLDIYDIMNIAPVYAMYEAIVDRAYTEFHNTPLCIKAREALPWLSKGEINELEWRRFAKLFDISNRKAHCFYWKVSFWELREGLTISR